MEVFLCSFIAMEGNNEILCWDVMPGIEIRVLKDSLVPNLFVQYSFTGIDKWRRNGASMYVYICKSVKWKTRKGEGDEKLSEDILNMED